jgi:hypothetical protein
MNAYWLRLYEENIFLVLIRCGTIKTGYAETIRLSRQHHHPKLKASIIDLLNSLSLSLYKDDLLQSSDGGDERLGNEPLSDDVQLRPGILRFSTDRDIIPDPILDSLDGAGVPRWLVGRSLYLCSQTAVHI